MPQFSTARHSLSLPMRELTTRLRDSLNQRNSYCPELRNPEIPRVSRYAHDADQRENPRPAWT